jgi:effector-binding domain-containing protein
MSYTVETRHMTGTRLLVVRRRARVQELSRVVPDACGAVWNFIRESGVRSPGRNVAVYTSCNDGLFDLEVGVEVGADAAGRDDVVLSATPAGMAATVTHFGSYALLSVAHDALRAWCTANQHRLAGPSWEVYGHWSDDPAKVRTDIFYLTAGK